MHKPTVLILFCTVSLVAAYAWSVTVRSSVRNQNGDAVIVNVCSGKTEYKLLCNLSEPDCSVISPGYDDLECVKDVR
jgi:hypothetical protein